VRFSCFGSEKKSLKLRWSSECDKEVNLSQVVLISRPFLRLSNFNFPFIVHVDASARYWCCIVLKV